MSQDTDTRPRLIRRFASFWEVVLLVSIMIGIVEIYRDSPALLSGWNGMRLGMLLAALLGFYALFKRFEQRQRTWPRPFKIVVLYVATQLVVSLLLLEYSDSEFIGPLFLLAGQIAGALPPRRWPLPLGAVFLALGWNMGVGDAVRVGQWSNIVGVGFFLVWIAAIMTLTSVLIQEHTRNEQLIRELRAAQIELERSAAQAEELAALRERTRLAREMHDSIGHALVLVIIKLEAAQRLYAVDMGRGDGELEATRSLVRTTMTELRRSLADLRAPLPDHHDLPSALQRVATESSARSGLTIRCDTAADLPAMAPATSEALWRVAREALANVERHAAAASVDISLRHDRETLVLRIADDGSGIAPAALERSGHYGITGMRERVEGLGGALQLGLRPGGGTLIEARVPLVTAIHTAS